MSNAFPVTIVQPHRAPPDYSQIALLVVDDEIATLELCLRLLKRLGFNDIDTAANGVEALARLSEKKYAAVISDWNMPEMNGLELVKNIRAHDRLRRLPFLMTSVDGGVERARVARQAGVNAFLIKPFDAPVLRAKLQEVIGSLPAMRAA